MLYLFISFSLGQESTIRDMFGAAARRGALGGRAEGQGVGGGWEVAGGAAWGSDEDEMGWEHIILMMVIIVTLSIVLILFSLIMYISASLYMYIRIIDRKRERKREEAQEA